MTDKDKIRKYVDDYVRDGWYIMSDYNERWIAEDERNALRDGVYKNKYEFNLKIEFVR